MAGRARQRESDPDLIHRERVGAVFRQMPVTLTVTLLNAALMVIVLDGGTNPALLGWWAGLTVLVTLARLAGWQIHRRGRWMHFDTSAWARFLVAGSLVSGILWGGGSALLFPGNPLYQLFLAFVVGGMCAGAVTVNSSYFPSLAAFVLPAAIPLAARFMVQADKLHLAMATMTLVFAAALLFIGRRFNAYFIDTFALQAALAERSRELDETNDSLREEMARRQATEATLRQSQRLEAVGRLTGGIAHDFNNVLAGVIGFVGIAIRRLDKDTHVVPLLENALRSADRGAQLTQRLLAFARKQTLNPKPVDLTALVAGMRALLEQALGPASRIELALDGDPVAAQVDAGQLELAILNLAINARDAMPEGGTLVLGVERRIADGATPPGLPPDHYAVVSVVDEGTGMDEETLANAFEPFFTTKAVGAGSGLGLSMVQGFAAQSGGTVLLASKLGEGTRAEIWLPLADATPSEVAAPASPVPVTAQARILLCDDDADARGAVAEILRGDGHAVREVGAAADALDLLAGGEEVDILITDYAMPGMNGADLLAEARRHRPRLRTLLISGHPAALRDEDRRATILAKPFTPAGLAGRIAELQNQR